MKISLKNKNAFVCGSTDGIGKATAIELAELGANVTLCARNEEKLKATMSLLEVAANQVHQYLVADFSQPSNLKAKLEDRLSAGSQYHILINNTGGPPGGPALGASEEEFRVAFNQHLICNHILATSLIPGMKEFKYGRIINVISTSVKQPLNNLGVSNTIRGAVANWSKTLANEVGKYGITVNNVLPGATNTGRLNSIIENKAQKSNVSFQESAAKMVANIPAGRFAEPKETAYAIAFLASESASYINGINLPVDGGRTACL